jgi:hypothetical protein
MRKKPEFSKLIMLTAGAFNIIVIVFSCIMVWRTEDLTPLAYLIPSTAAEVATGTAFYYNKAKAENRLKLMKIYGIEVNEKNFDGGEVNGYDGYDRSDWDNVGVSDPDSGCDYVVSDSVSQSQG